MFVLRWDCSTISVFATRCCSGRAPLLCLDTVHALLGLLGVHRPSALQAVFLRLHQPFPGDMRAHWDGSWRQEPLSHARTTSDEAFLWAVCERLVTLGADIDEPLLIPHSSSEGLRYLSLRQLLEGSARENAMLAAGWAPSRRFDNLRAVLGILQLKPVRDAESLLSRMVAAGGARRLLLMRALEDALAALQPAAGSATAAFGAVAASSAAAVSDTPLLVPLARMLSVRGLRALVAEYVC
jgi:hypothetical protein